jgi:hypothetical protein
MTIKVRIEMKKQLILTPLFLVLMIQVAEARVRSYVCKLSELPEEVAPYINGDGDTEYTRRYHGMDDRDFAIMYKNNTDVLISIKSNCFPSQR